MTDEQGEPEVRPEKIDLRLQGVDWQLQINPWGYEKGRPWLLRFVKVLGSLAGGSVAAGDIGIDHVLDKISDRMLAELVDECEAQTVCVSPDGQAVPFTKLRPLLKARYDVTLRVVACHLRVNFGPFFASLGSVLNDLTGGAIGGGTDET